MGIGTFARAFRTGLEAILLLFTGSIGFSQDLEVSPENEILSSAPQGVNLSLKDLGEVESSNCKQRYSNPLNLLFLLPGLLFFIFALVTRNYPKSFFFFGLLFLVGSSGPQRTALIRQAEESFVSEHYGEAMKSYRQVEKLLPCNSAVLYNLGVISHYMGQPGYAVHYLRRSLRLAPADKQVRSALQALQGHYNLAGQVAAPLPVHPDVAYLLLLTFANASFILGAFVIRTRKVHFLISLVLVTIAALGCLAFLLGRISLEARAVGVVVSEEGELFRVPEEDSKSWFELPEGTSLWIRGQTGRYYLVETPSQIEGWVHSDTILID